jgi:hypothetical protein
MSEDSTAAADLYHCDRLLDLKAWGLYSTNKRTKYLLGYTHFDLDHSIPVLFNTLRYKETILSVYNRKYELNQNLNVPKYVKGLGNLLTEPDKGEVDLIRHTQGKKKFKMRRTLLKKIRR